MESDEDNGILHHFLKGRNLRKVFSHLCNHTSGHSVDPISDVAYIMLTCPVETMISEVSCALHASVQHACSNNVGTLYFAHNRWVWPCSRESQLFCILSWKWTQTSYTMWRTSLPGAWNTIRRWVSRTAWMRGSARSAPLLLQIVESSCKWVEDASCT